MKTKRWCRKRAHHFTRSFQAHVPTNHQRYYRRRRPGRSSDCVTLARECVALGRSSEKRPRVACGAARRLVATISARATAHHLTLVPSVLVRLFHSGGTVADGRS